MGEWFNPAVLKTVMLRHRGFESPSLFQKYLAIPETIDNQSVFRTERPQQQIDSVV